MTMESIEKLRELNTFGTVKVDGDLVATNMLMVCATKEEINEIADEIEREIESRYMPQPCDMDGVPVKIGDELSHDGFARNFIVHSYELTDGAWSVWDVANGATHLCQACRHVRPRTIEDVLRDVWKEALDYAKSDMWRNSDDVFAERADEIRELMEVDE